MLELVGQQRADGGWDLNQRLAAVLGRRLADLEAALPAAAGDREEAHRAWATALALAWLEHHAGAWQDEWRLLAGKARVWLERMVAAPAKRESWWKAAERFIGRW